MALGKANLCREAFGRAEPNRATPSRVIPNRVALDRATLYSTVRKNSSLLDDPAEQPNRAKLVELNCKPDSKETNKRLSFLSSTFSIRKGRLAVSDDLFEVIIIFHIVLKLKNSYKGK